MKFLLSGLAVLATTTALLTATAPSASADTTDVTFSLSGGALSVTAAASAALPNGASGSTSVTGQLGQTEVSDIRGGTTGWTARAATTAFDNSVPDDPATTGVDESVPATTTATAVTYDAGGRTTTGTVTTTRPLTPVTLSSTPATVVTASAVVGNNTAAWNPTLAVTLPSSSTVGDYHGTITTSVS